MNIMGWCEKCRRTRPVHVSGAGMARLANGNVAVGVCANCRQDEDDLRRSEPMRDLVEHVELEHERELPPGISLREVRAIHTDMHRRRRYDHRHVGPHDNILRTRR